MSFTNMAFELFISFGGFLLLILGFLLNTWKAILSFGNLVFPPPGKTKAG